MTTRLYFVISPRSTSSALKFGSGCEWVIVNASNSALVHCESLSMMKVLHDTHVPDTQPQPVQDIEGR